ncbi:MAG: helicase [Anaerolineales bacterium]|nr:helicase [Anaerolineales bacterium]
MNYVFFDLETQNLFQDVGGYENVSKLLVACGVTWSTQKNDFSVHWEQDVPALIAELKSATKVIGFNLIGFDYRVLQPYSPETRFASIPTLDMLLDLQKILGFRISLDTIASATLGTAKIADGANLLSGFVMANWIRLPNIARQMWTSPAASMNSGVTMGIFFINQNWAAN